MKYISRKRVTIFSGFWEIRSLQGCNSGLNTDPVSFRIPKQYCSLSAGLCAGKEHAADDS